MTRLVWLVAGVLVVLWSLIAWGAYGLIDLFGSTAARHADVLGHPGSVEWLSWGMAALRNVGLAAVILVWGVVSLLILAVPTAISFVMGRAFRPARPMDWNDEFPRPGYRDVTPETASGPAGDPRRIERR